MAEKLSSSRDLRLPSHLCEAAEKLIQGTRFSTVEELLAFVLQELTSERAAQLDESERRTIKNRLRDLGYL